MGEVKASLGALEERLRDLDASLQRALLEIPNLPDPSAPPGDREEDAALVRVVGERPAFTFAPRDHMELAGRLIDVERASRTSGSRFGYLLGDVAMLWLALSRFAIDTLRGKGFELVIPPVMVREQAMWDTGFFPTDQQAVYGLPSDDLFLVGTSEVPLAAFHAGETLSAGDLPLRYCGLSACFRREAGAAGRDTRGIFRTHQFEKVEMFSFCDPARSGEEHEYLLSIEEEIAGALGLHYRIVNIAAGDLGGLGGEEVRHRGLVARAGPVSRADVLLELHRLPGAPARHPGPRGRRAEAGAHVERHGGDELALGDRRPRDPPAGGRLGRPAAGARRPRRAVPARRLGRPVERVASGRRLDAGAAERGGLENR